MESPESTLVPGYRLDRYELLCPIASGGMASVWLARLRGKRGFEKLFAIKTIKTELISDPNFQEMFLDEARIASRIVHPNVAQILELGEQDDVLYIVMEYVDGDSLAKVNRLALKRGSPLPPGVSLRIIAETCAGLHAAHQLKDANGESLGVVHRDVSPQNILLTGAGSAKVIDFGLVKAKNRGAAETQSGVVKGKIRYMAPEQVGGKALDHRADVWACGMCLYELITGHPPYHKEDDLDVVKRLMSADPLPPFDVALPPPIEKVLTRALVKEPEGRFESCAAMRRAIEAAIDELELQAENDDVAEFVRQTLPDLATKRASTIAKAIEAAETRSTQVPSLEGHGPQDIAYAATEVSARDPTSDEALPLTKRVKHEDLAGDRGRSGEAQEALDSDGHRIVSSETARATTLTQQLLDERRKRSGAGYWLAALAVAGAGAWILWPRPPPSGPAPGVVPAATTEPSSPSASGPATPPPSANPTDVPAPTSSQAPSENLELDPTAEALDPAGADADAGATAKNASTPPRAPVSRPPSTPATSPAPAAPPWDGGLSPGAMSAAAIMLVPKPTATEPPPAPSPPPPPPLPPGEQP